jgi:hypothetical protein
MFSVGVFATVKSLRFLTIVEAPVKQVGTGDFDDFEGAASPVIF